MRRSFVFAALAASLLVVLAPEAGALGPDAPVKASVTISAVNQPAEGTIKVCIQECELLPDRDQQATLWFAIDPARETGRIMYRDRGVLYGGQPFAIEGTVETIIVSELPEVGYVQYLLEGRYQPRGEATIPAGSFQIWLNTYPDSAYLTVYLSDFSVPFSYINQGPAVRYLIR